MFHLHKMKKLFLIISFSSFLYSDTDWNDPNNCSLPDNNYLIETILNNMTLEQKVGQIIMPEINSITPDDAKKYQFGTILNGGGGFPNMGGGFPQLGQKSKPKKTAQEKARLLAESRRKLKLKRKKKKK